jgi:hypothetical protein
MAAESGTATAEEAISKVRAAARFLHSKGTSGYAEFNNRDGSWVWKDSYVFVYDCRQDKMIAHPMRPDLVGKPIMQITDNAGKYIFKELCKAGTRTAWRLGRVRVVEARGGRALAENLLCSGRGYHVRQWHSGKRRYL